MNTFFFLNIYQRHKSQDIDLIQQKTPKTYDDTAKGFSYLFYQKLDNKQEKNRDVIMGKLI